MLFKKKPQSKTISEGITVGIAHINRKRYKFLLLAAICLLVAGVAIYYGYARTGKQSATKTASDAQADAQAVGSSYDLINNQDYKGASESLSSRLEGGIKDDEQRYQALSNLGVAYLAQKQPNKALETLLQAEEIKKQETAADVLALIALLYEQKGDKNTAIAYYKKAINSIKATPETADDGYIPNHEGAIKSLGGSL